MAECQPLKMLAVPTSSRAGSLPQGMCSVPTVVILQNCVGAGLLAMAVCQPLKMLAVPTSSRASRIVAPPLPQGIVVSLKTG
jgi:hypothetical protein